MLRATSVKAATTWREPAADTVVLQFDDRHHRPAAMTGTRGLQFTLDLADAVALRGGDALVLEDGRLVEVVAAAEPLVEIRSLDPLNMMRIAWHLGNRHLPVQIAGKHLRIRRDPEIEDLANGFGARVVQIEAPFDPEGGAYVAAGPDHDHGHHHDHHHGHDHHGHHHHDHTHDDGHHAHGHCGHDHCSHDHHHGHVHHHEHDQDHGHDHGRAHGAHKHGA